MILGKLFVSLLLLWAVSLIWAEGDKDYEEMENRIMLFLYNKLCNTTWSQTLTKDIKECNKTIENSVKN